MVIKNETIIKEYKIYSAVEFEKVFKIKDDLWGMLESDEDYIVRKLEESDKYYTITFMEDPRDNTYEEYWLIREVKK